MVVCETEWLKLKPRMPWRSHKLIAVLREAGIVEPLCGTEIGVQFGKNAAALLWTFPKLYLYLVDSYDPLTLVHRSRTVVQARAAADEAVKPYGCRVHWLVMLSVTAAKFVPGLLDFVFIDAAHDYDNVKADIATWLPKVRPGGILAGHDYSRAFRGVKRAVGEYFPGRFQRRGDLWWVIV